MANVFTIKQFNEQAINDYLRTYLFKVDITYPDALDTFTCEWVSNTATPVVVTSAQVVDYMHTQIRRGGKTNPQQWPVTIRDDSWGGSFSFFNTWRNSIYPNMTSTTPSSYKGDATLRLLNPSLELDRIYRLYGVWPMEIGAITLDYESDNISTFPVTFAFDFFETGSAIE
jgi:hypothetical protein